MGWCPSTGSCQAGTIKEQTQIKKIHAPVFQLAPEAGRLDAALSICVPLPYSLLPAQEEVILWDLEKYNHLCQEDGSVDKAKCKWEDLHLDL